jgi:hypothetical protein
MSPWAASGKFLLSLCTAAPMFTGPTPADACARALYVVEDRAVIVGRSWIGAKTWPRICGCRREA